MSGASSVSDAALEDTGSDPVKVIAPASAAARRVYGETLWGLTTEGRELRAGVFNENEVRAAAGLTMALGAVAFAYAALAKIYLPIQIVSTLFFVEFFVRVTFGLQYSPMGIVARWLAQRQEPQWVSAKPKRFAWALGVVLAFAMMIITNVGIRGPLPLTLCLICLTLMWLESVLSLCLGCETHGFLVRRGWAAKDQAYEICTNGACEFTPPAGRQAVPARASRRASA